MLTQVDALLAMGVNPGSDLTARREKTRGLVQTEV
jgi:hypothetical protein